MPYGIFARGLNVPKAWSSSSFQAYTALRLSKDSTATLFPGMEVTTPLTDGCCPLWFRVVNNQTAVVITIAAATSATATGDFLWSLRMKNRERQVAQALERNLVSAFFEYAFAEQVLHFG